MSFPIKIEEEPWWLRIPFLNIIALLIAAIIVLIESLLKET